MTRRFAELRLPGEGAEPLDWALAIQALVESYPDAFTDGAAA
jgi:hypothetical protein